MALKPGPHFTRKDRPNNNVCGAKDYERCNQNRELWQQRCALFDELRHERDEEDKAFRVERRNDAAIPEHPSGVGIGAVRRQRIKRGCSAPKLDPEPYEVGRAEDFDDCEQRGRCSEDRPCAE